MGFFRIRKLDRIHGPSGPEHFSAAPPPPRPKSVKKRQEQHRMDSRRRRVLTRRRPCRSGRRRVLRRRETRSSGCARRCVTCRRRPGCSSAWCTSTGTSTAAPPTSSTSSRCAPHLRILPDNPPVSAAESLANATSPRVSVRAGEEGPEAAARRRPGGGPQRRVPRPRMPQAGQHDPRPDQVSPLLQLRCLQIPRVVT